MGASEPGDRQPFFAKGAKNGVCPRGDEAEAGLGGDETGWQAKAPAPQGIGAGAGGLGASEPGDRQPFFAKGAKNGVAWKKPGDRQPFFAKGAKNGVCPRGDEAEAGAWVRQNRGTDSHFSQKARKTESVPAGTRRKRGWAGMKPVGRRKRLPHKASGRGRGAWVRQNRGTDSHFSQKARKTESVPAGTGRERGAWGRRNRGTDSHFSQKARKMESVHGVTKRSQFGRGQAVGRGAAGAGREAGRGAYPLGGGRVP